MKLLIVEDNREMRRLIREITERPGDVVFECGDGVEAVLLYGGCRPDWVLMDVELPGIDGLSAARQITSLFPGAKIVVVTNYDTASLREAAAAAGALAYVVKENLTELRRVLAL